MKIIKYCRNKTVDSVNEAAKTAGSAPADLATTTSSSRTAEFFCTCKCTNSKNGMNRTEHTPEQGKNNGGGKDRFHDLTALRQIAKGGRKGEKY